MILPTAFNITTLIMLALTVWSINSRYRTRLENNWPLFYYLGLVLYTRKFDTVLEFNYVLLAIICATLLRFEFLGGWFVKVLQFVETAILVYVIIRFISAVFGSG
ncbi:MAG: hypothetical protein HY820_06565 [Acidobacteria bacterium]|nr:hypothetical protein [Acidobacteriota bacterium]